MDGERYTDRFPANVPDEATLYLTTPDANAAGALRVVVLREGIVPEHPFDDVLTVRASASQLRTLCMGWAGTLNKVDLKDTRCRLVSGKAAPSASELMRTQRLWDLIRWIDGQWVQDLLGSRRLVTHFQPIVYNAEPSQVFAYECLLRGIEDDGQLIPPNRLFAAARAVDMLRPLDEAARLKAIESATQHKLTGCVFINLNPRSIDEPTKCLASTMEAVLASGIPADRFIFEVVESEKITDIDQLLRLLDYCRQTGCRVALDDVGEGYSSLNLLARIKPDFIKLDICLIRDVDHDPYIRRVTEKVIELAKDLEVETVVEGVETIGQWQWAAEQKAEYAQGYLFARPSQTPPTSAFSGSLQNPAAVDATEPEAEELQVAKESYEVG